MALAKLRQCLLASLSTVAQLHDANNNLQCSNQASQVTSLKLSPYVL